MKFLPHAPRSLRFGLLIAAIVGIATAAVSWQQVARERQNSLDDLERRADLLRHRLSPAAIQAMQLPDSQVAAAMGDRMDGHSRFLGFALFKSDGTLVAAGQGLSELDPELSEFVRSVALTGRGASAIVHGPAGNTHIAASPLAASDGRALGTLAVLHDAQFLEDRTTRGMLRGALWTVSVTLVLLLVISGIAWATFERPLHLLAEWMRKLRFGDTDELPPQSVAVRRLTDESEFLAASFRAARSSERHAAQGTVRSERAWTPDRLQAHGLDALDGKQLVVVSNREPYMHQLKEGKPHVVMPASGLVTALDPVLRACGGLWVAHGAGDADRATANAAGCVAVPPESPRYTLRRVWISKEEEQGYYYGFSNEGLWPLCHLTHERPIFRASDWEHYVHANRRFADAVLQEVGSEAAVVLVQDYQLALVPALLKEARPHWRVGLFWHIPWPNPEAFRICPYRVELLHGMLGADLVGFHLQQHCNNFLDSVDRMVEARLDWDRFAVNLKGRSTLVAPFPISVQPWSEKQVETGSALAEQLASLRRLNQLGGMAVGVGVDRIDYTKGIAERFRALERFFELHPEQRGRFSFVQLGAPSRTHIPRYRELVAELEAMADRINWRFHSEGWKPIHFMVGHHDHRSVYAFLRMASVCIVSSLHDGMNLVAKEYVAAQGDASDDPGVLVLSEFAGAARDLPEALIVNPYDTEEFAGAIYRAVSMDAKEKRQRMTRMRIRVHENNVYRWAADFLGALSQAGREAEPASRER